MTDADAEMEVANIAVDREWVTTDQVEEALEIQQKMSEMGITENLDAILVKKGWLNGAQIRELRRAAGAGQPVEIGGFEILGRIGRGGMGAVYKARQKSMDRLVALKILPPSLARDQQYVGRFFREARAVARLNHPNIIQGIDVGVSGKFHYFAMEYVEGRTLQDRLDKQGALGEAEAVEVAIQTARALEHAAKHGMVHRDVKPENIMFASDGTAKLCDLGLARSTSGESAMTQTGIAVGTPHYISPEQARGETDVDIRSDIYSLGATLYYTVVGKTPYAGTSAAVVMTKHITDEVPNPRRLRPDLSNGLCSVILKMMAKDRARRYQTPTELIKDLERVRAGGAPAARMAATGSAAAVRALRASQRRGTAPDVRAKAEATGAPRAAPVPWPLIAAAASVLAAVAVVALIAWIGPPDEDDDPNPDITTITARKKSANVTPPAGRKKKAGDTRPSRAEMEYRTAVRFAEKNPTQFREILGRLRDAIDRTEGTVWQLKAQQDYDTWERKQVEAGEAWLAKKRAAADALMDKDRHAEALRLLNDLDYHLMCGPAHSAVGAERQRIERAALTRFAELKAEAEKRMDKGDYRGARAAIAPARTIGTPSVAARLPAYEKDLARRRKERRDAAARQKTEKERAEAETAFAAAEEAILSAAWQGDWNGAGKRARVESRQARYASFPECRTRLARLAGDLASAQRVFTEAAAALLGRTGVRLRVRGVSRPPVPGAVKSIAGTVVTIEYRLGPGGVGLDRVDLRTVDVADLADLAGAGSGTAPGAYRKALLHFFRRDLARSAPLFARARENAALAAGAAYYLTFAEKEAKEAREKAAAALLAEIDRLHAQLREAMARKAPAAELKRRAGLLNEKITEFQKCADTDVYRRAWE